MKQTPHSSRDGSPPKGRFGPTWGASLRKFYSANWFLIWLAFILAAGMVFPQAFAPILTEAVQVQGQKGVVFFVMLMMSLALPTDALFNTFRQPGPTLMAVVLNWGAIPLLALLTAPLLHREFHGGVYLAAAMPCSMASASVWTRRAGGNDAISLMVTVITNASCFVVTPFLVLLLTGKEVQNFDAREKVLELSLLVLAPLLLGQLARRSDVIRAFCDRHRALLGVATQVGLLSVIMLGAVKTGERLHAATATSPKLLQIGIMLIAVLGIHTATLLSGGFLAALMGVSRRDGLAVAIAGSQKTLMIGLPMAGELQTSILPLVAFHAGQLLIDAIYAERQRRIGERLELRPAEAEVT